MSDEAPRKKGCLARLMMLVLMLGAAGLGAALYFAARPQDLSDIGGYGDGAPAQRRDMRAVLRNSLDRGYPVTLTEEQLNGWLGQTLEARQGGLLEKQVSLEGVWVRLEEGHAEVVMERRVFGRPFTVSMFLTMNEETGELHLDGGPYHEDFPKPPRGGRFGRLVVPQGFLLLVLPAYQKLADVFTEEVGLGIREMARVKIGDGRLTMQPRSAGDADPGMSDSF